jgi:hypothetical protein
MRESFKGYITLFYLEYDMRIHRRFIYIYQHAKSPKKRYKNKKSHSDLHRRGFLLRSGTSHFLRYPNSIAPFYFRKMIGLEYGQAFYWQLKRKFLKTR